MILRLSLHLPDKGTSARTARHLSRCLMEDLNVRKPIIDDVETIISELCSNVIRHAESRATHFRVELEFDQAQVIITVCDEGKGFSRDAIPSPGSSRPDGLGGKRYGGYGLSLLDGLSDKITFSMTEPQGTTVRVEKRLEYETKQDTDLAAETDAGGDGVTVGLT